MSEVLHANVFFFITGIAVIVFTSLLCVVLFQGIKILQSIRRIVMRVEDTADALGADINEIRTNFSKGGAIQIVKHLLFGNKSDIIDDNTNTINDTTKKNSRKQSFLKIKDKS